MTQLLLVFTSLPGEHPWDCPCDDCQEMFEVELPDDWIDSRVCECGKRRWLCGSTGFECRSKEC